MSSIHDDPAALKALQDAIYRDKVLRARAMTPEQRLEEVCRLSNMAMDKMLEDAMRDLGTTDTKAGWAEVRRRVDELDRAEDREFFTTEKPTDRN